MSVIGPRPLLVEYLPYYTKEEHIMTLKNRVVMMPMGSDFAGHDGELSDEHIKYYELRARGGTGLSRLI